jgi:hypothetical protein
MLNLVITVKNDDRVSQIAHPRMIESDVAGVWVVLDVFHETSILSVVDAAGRTGLANDHAAELGEPRLQVLPDPAGQVLARRVLETWDLIQVVMVELVFQRLEGVLHIAKIAEPAHVLVNLPPQANLDAERVPMQTTAFMPRGHIRQQVGCLERKFLIDFQKCSSRDPEILMSL